MNNKLEHYLNGEWVTGEKAKISIFDLGVTRGLAVFETLRTYGGKANRLDEHVIRLQQSLIELGLAEPKDVEKLEDIIEKGLERNKLDDAALKVMVTGGVNEGMLSGNESFMVVFMPLSLPSKDKYEQGAALISHREGRTLAHVKTTNYTMAKRGMMRAQQLSADDALYVDMHGNIYETTTSNIFFVKDGRLITPHREILFGITRAAVIELAKQAGIPVEERTVNLNELSDFDEVFQTGSLKEIMSIRAIDDTTYEANGPITTQLAQSYKKTTKGN